MRFVFTIPEEQKDWLTETSNHSYSQADIVRIGIRLLMDLDWKPENEN